MRFLANLYWLALGISSGISLILFFLIVTFFWAPKAFAQTGSMSLESMRAPFGVGKRVVTVSVQALRIDAVGITTPISGQTVPLGAFDLFSTTILKADFPGQKTVPMVVSALRLVITGSGLGWQIPASHPAWVDIPVTTVIVPAGKGIGYRYDMPAVGPGTLQWAVGSPSGTIPTPVVLGPVVTASITPPAIIPTPSLPGDCSPPLTQLSQSGAFWTVKDGKVFRDDIALLANSYPDLDTICVDGTTIRAISPTKGYERWNDVTKAWQ